MYEIRLSRKAQKFYEETDKKNVKILNRCFETVSKNPYFHANIKKLHGVFEGSFRYKAGNLRIIYSIDESKKIVYVEVIVTRGSAY